MRSDYLERVRAHLARRATAATDPRVTVGGRVLLVELDRPDHGLLAGLAHRPDGEREGPWPTAASELAGLATTASTRLDRAVGIATLNALSAPDMDWRTGDPMASLGGDVDVVATVGFFRPAMAKFGGATVRVVERDPPSEVDSPPGVSVETYAPANCDAAFEGADVCFVTGSVLVYGGIDRYLDALSVAGVSPVVVVGATASHWPVPAFEAGVDVVAGARVDDPERARDRVAAGDCGPGLHDHGVTKGYVTAEGTPGLALTDASSGAE